MTERTKTTPPDVALTFLHPDLCAILASLHGAPRSVAEATIQLLPFGSRAALEATDPPLAVASPTWEEGSDHRPLALTPFAYEVMAVAAAAADADPAGVEDWTRRAQAAAAAAAAKAARNA
jgi:hypothetical protein